jgi:hypothetical protein
LLIQRSIIWLLLAAAVAVQTEAGAVLVDLKQDH